VLFVASYMLLWVHPVCVVSFGCILCGQLTVCVVAVVDVASTNMWCHMAFSCGILLFARV